MTQTKTQINIIETKTWKKLNNFDKIIVYETLYPTINERILNIFMWINPFGFFVMLIDYLKYKDIIDNIKKEVDGRNIIFSVFRLEKEGDLIKGIETLSRKQLIDELKKYQKEEK